MAVKNKSIKLFLNDSINEGEFLHSLKTTASVEMNNHKNKRRYPELLKPFIEELKKRFNRNTSVHNVMPLVDEDVLLACFKLLKDNYSKKAYKIHLESNLSYLLDRLKNQRYEFKPLRTKFINKKNKPRKVYIEEIEDKVVSKLMSIILEVAFLPNFKDFVYSYIPGRSCKCAFKAIDSNLKTQQEPYLLQLDIYKCFDNIDMKTVKRLIKKRIKDLSFLKLLNKRFPIRRKSTLQGLATGAMISNIFLNKVFDSWYSEPTSGKIQTWVIRYSDNFIFGIEKPELSEALIAEFSSRLEQYGLKLNTSKTQFRDLSKESMKIFGLRSSYIDSSLELQIPDNKIVDINEKLLKLSRTSKDKEKWLDDSYRLLINHFNYYGIQNHLSFFLDLCNLVKALYSKY